MFCILASAEGVSLGLFEYDELKQVDKRKKPVKVSCLTDHITDHASMYVRGSLNEIILMFVQFMQFKHV